MKATGIILVGGKSSRMGTNKALLTIDGKLVIERIAEEMQTVTDSLIIVTNTFHTYEFLNLPMVEDKYKGLGPLAGIHAGLEASTTDKNLVAACDMPFISTEIGAYLLDNLNGYQACVPEIYGQLHPLFAAYRKEVKDIFSKSLEMEELRVRRTFENISAKIVTEKDLIREGFQIRDSDFFNMNYPEEYEIAKKLFVKPTR